MWCEAVTPDAGGGGRRTTRTRAGRRGRGGDGRCRPSGSTASSRACSSRPARRWRCKQAGRRAEGPDGEGGEGGAERLTATYDQPGRGIQLRGGGGRLPVAQRAGERRWVRALLRERPARLGRAALETLAIIAYKQPATRAEIEAVRGVDADSAISTLLARRLIKIAGRKEAVGPAADVRHDAGVSRGVRPQGSERTAGAEGNRSGAGAGR